MKSIVIKSLERENPDKKKRLQLVIAASMFLFQETAEFGRRLFHSFFFRDLVVLIVYSLDSVADTGEHLVGDGVQGIAEHSHGQMVTEDLHRVAFLAVNTCDIDHRHVHTDIADILCLLAIDKAVAVAIAEMAVQSVGISDRYGCDDTVMIDLAFAAVAHGITGGYVAQLQNRRLQRRDVVNDLIVAAVDAIKSKAKTAHIQLALREVLDAGGVVDMAEYLMVKGCLQFLATLIEELELMGREVVE